jgi:hypothetical protein
MKIERCFIFGILFLFSIAFISSAAVDDSLHLTIQTRDANGNIETGTFEFVFNISTTDDCNNVLHTDINSSVTTDSKGIVSYYLENVDLDYTDQYYLCYSRDGILKSNSKMSRVPCAFNSKFLGGYDENFFLPLNTSAVGTFSGITSGDSQLLDSFDSSFFMPLNTSVVGNFDFNGGWTSGGFSILNGDIYAQTGYFYNITGLDVSTLKVNGSILPQSGFDNQFDLGSSVLRWRDLWLGRDLFVNGSVGIGTTSPSSKLHVLGDVLLNITSGLFNVIGNSVFEGSIKVEGSIAESETPAENTLYAESLPKAWVNFDGTSCSGSSGSCTVASCPIRSSFNIECVDRVAPGQFRVYWDRNFTDTNYAVSYTTNIVTTINNFARWVSNQQTGLIEVNSWEGAARVDLSINHVTAFGRQ